VRALRRLGRPQSYPVVFTSTLRLQARTGANLGDVVYALTQTSQVWLDHKVREDDGELVSTWDYVAGLFCPGVVEAMMDTFSATLRALPHDGRRLTAPAIPVEQQARRAEAEPGGRVSGGPRLLHDTLLGDASDELALVSPSGERLSRRKLAAAAHAVAERLLAAGLQPGESVYEHLWRTNFSSAMQPWLLDCSLMSRRTLALPWSS
jgi:non-ribosomal peptide synthetase component F